MSTLILSSDPCFSYLMSLFTQVVSYLRITGWMTAVSKLGSSHDMCSALPSKACFQFFLWMVEKWFIALGAVLDCAGWLWELIELQCAPKAFCHIPIFFLEIQLGFRLPLNHSVLEVSYKALCLCCPPRAGFVAPSQGLMRDEFCCIRYLPPQLASWVINIHLSVLKSTMKVFPLRVLHRLSQDGVIHPERVCT